MSKPWRRLTYGRPSSSHPDLSHNGNAALANDQRIQPVPTEAS